MTGVPDRLMRPEQVELLANQAARLGCAALVDAMGRQYSHRAHLPPMVSPDPSRFLFGQAVTIGFLPYRADLAPADGFGGLFHQAVDAASAGAVLVLSSGGYPEVSHAGGVKLLRAVTHRLGGVLADGCLRDFAELRSYDLPVWCRSEAVRWGGDVVMPAMANVPVEVAGVTIAPGDFVYVDTAGGVVIPADSVASIFESAEQVKVEDTAYAAEIRSEDG